MKPDEFFAQFGPSAVECYEQTGLFASVQLAQLVQEVGWDVKTPKDIDSGKESYNLFNIKGTGPAGSVTIWTMEYYDGQWVKIKDQFRAYNSYAEAFADHANLLLTAPWYEAARYASTPKKQIQAIYDGGYATDPHYVGALDAQMWLTQRSKLQASWFATEAEVDAAVNYLNTVTNQSVAPQNSILDSFNLTEWDAKADDRKVAEAALRRRFSLLTTDHSGTMFQPAPEWMVFVMAYRVLMFLLRMLGK